MKLAHVSLLLGSIIGRSESATMSIIGKEGTSGQSQYGLIGVTSHATVQIQNGDLASVNKIEFSSKFGDRQKIYSVESFLSGLGNDSGISSIYGTLEGGVGSVVLNNYDNRLTASFTEDDGMSLLTTQPDGTILIVKTLYSDVPEETSSEDVNETLLNEAGGPDEGERKLGGATSLLRSNNVGINLKSAINNQLKAGNEGVSRKTLNGAVMDVMVLYTDKAKCAALQQGPNCGGSKTPIEDVIRLAETETNQAYANSDVSTRINIVHIDEERDGYDESAGFSQALSDIRGTSDGKMDYVHDLRDTHGADLVALIIEHSSFCGIAYLGPQVSLGFSVTARQCATGYYSFGHEIGHNLGCHHDRNNASPQAYEHGYQDPAGRFRSTLAYNCPNGGCPRVIFYSNPSTGYNGYSIGNADNDNGRKIDESGPIVAGWKSPSLCTSDSDCDDGNDCNGEETCNNGSCELDQNPPSCNDDSVCTVDSCIPTTGQCVFTPITCDDYNACTDDSCNASSGCVHTPISNCCGNGICESNEDASSCAVDCAVKKELLTTMNSNNGSYGNMFDITAKADIVITSLDINVQTGSLVVHVYTKAGSYVNFDDSLNGWTQIADALEITGLGGGQRTILPDFDTPVAISEGSTQAFYVTVTTSDIRYTNGSNLGSIFQSNDHIDFFEGAGIAGYPPVSTFSPRIWNGYIIYIVDDGTSSPISSPTANPTFAPTTAPTTDTPVEDYVYISSFSPKQRLRDNGKLKTTLKFAVKTDQLERAVNAVLFVTTQFITSEGEEEKSNECRVNEKGRCFVKLAAYNPADYLSVKVRVQDISSQLGEYNAEKNIKKFNDCPVFSSSCETIDLGASGNA